MGSRIQNATSVRDKLISNGKLGICEKLQSSLFGLLWLKVRSNAHLEPLMSAKDATMGATDVTMSAEDATMGRKLVL